MNQLQPLILSNQGLYVWSEKPYKFAVQNNSVVVSNYRDSIKHGRYGKNLFEVQQFVSNKFFTPSGKIPDTSLFINPQFNTWIELTYNQNQDDILKYARSIIENGISPGVLMIDDTWQEDYGVWDFHPGRFTSPKRMIDELHDLGFKVMLWICPFVSPDQYLVYNELRSKRAFLLQKEKNNWSWDDASKPAIIRWWNGASALLDFTNDAAVKWFNEQLEFLQDSYNIDGFKFDAGDMHFYPPNALSKVKVTPNKHSELYAQFGLDYSLNEYRACWKMGGQPLAQRLHDKSHSWEDLQLLIPHMIIEGLVGYPFSCPDMIGGGDFKSFLNTDLIDQELVVRSAQCQALMPMMQFSVAPWRILDKKHFNAIKAAIELRKEFVPTILDLVDESAKNGTPVITNLEYYYPNEGLENIVDQFLLGENIIVSPMLKKGTKRVVVLPKGRWLDDKGILYEGGAEYTIDVPLFRLPYFIRQ